MRTRQVKRQYAGPRRFIRRLTELRSRFTSDATVEKITLLDALSVCDVRAPHLVIQWHRALCYLKAFPDSPDVYQRVCDLLSSFATRVRKLPHDSRARLDDSGIEGTRLYYEYSYFQAQWLAQRFPRSVNINWKEYEEMERLDVLLSYLLVPAEEDAFDSGEMTTPEWVALAKGSTDATDLCWILRQVKGASTLNQTWDKLYDAAAVPIQWVLDSASASITFNGLTPRRPHCRPTGLRKPESALSTIVKQPITGLRCVDKELGRRVIDVAMAPWQRATEMSTAWFTPTR